MSTKPIAVKPIAMRSFDASFSLKNHALIIEINKMDPALYVGNTIAAGKTSSASNKKKEEKRLGTPTMTPITTADIGFSIFLCLRTIRSKLMISAVANTTNKKTGLYDIDDVFWKILFKNSAVPPDINSIKSKGMLINLI